MEDSMIDMPNMVFDDKVGNKRVRDDEAEIHKGRLEKRPSGIFGVSDGGDHVLDGGESGGGGGIIDTLISNVFHKNTSGTEGEVEAGASEVKTGVSEVVADEGKREDLGGGDGGGGGGGGSISAFFSNIFHPNGSADDDGDQAKSDHLLNEVAEKTECLNGEPDGVGPLDINAERLPEKKDEVVDLLSKEPTAGPTLKSKPDDYAERVFFLNNN